MCPETPGNDVSLRGRGLRSAVAGAHCLGDGFEGLLQVDTQVMDRQAIQGVEQGLCDRVQALGTRYPVAQGRLADVDVFLQDVFELFEHSSHTSGRQARGGHARQAALEQAQVTFHADDVIDLEVAADPIDVVPRLWIHAELCQGALQLLKHGLLREPFNFFPPVVSHALEWTGVPGGLGVSSGRVGVVHEAVRNLVANPDALIDLAA